MVARALHGIAVTVRRCEERKAIALMAVPDVTKPFPWSQNMNALLNRKNFQIGMITLKKNDILGRNVTLSDGTASTNNVGTERTVNE